MAASVKGVSAKILKFGIAGGLIYWMVQKGLLDFSLLGQLLTPVHMSVCIGLIFGNIALNNYRWSLLLDSQALPSQFRVTFPLTLIGMFFNFAIPGAVGGDLVKGYYVTQNHPGKRMAAATTVVMDRLLGLYAMVLMAVVTILLNIGFVLTRPSLIQVTVMAVGGLVAMTVVFAFMFSSRVKAKNPLLKWAPKVPGGGTFVKLYDAIHAYGERKPALAKGLIASLMAQAMAVFNMAYVGWALGEHISLSTYFFAVPLAFIIMAIPIAPAGIGVG
ncbi:MAG: flippase-like domain-containing protein, partial [Bdellovibrionales bacterium]|nr:flippase-like domain-containing protein [Bdellovibrionales bacterium]